MSVCISREIIETAGLTKKQKLGVMKSRQSVLSSVALELLQKRGYVKGASLKVPGAHAFEASHHGEPTKIGIKTATDRWVAIPRDGSGGWGLLSAVDEVFVVTFDSHASPARLQVLAFSPKVLIATGEKVYAAAEKAGQTGIQWIPLDHHKGRNATSMAAGHLLPLATMVADELIEWQSTGVAAATLSQPTSSAPLKLSIAEAKAGLAEMFGVSPAAVKITIEA